MKLALTTETTKRIWGARKFDNLRVSRLNFMTVAAFVVTVFLLIPLVAILTLAIGGSGDAWPHLIKFVIPHTLSTSLSVLALTLILTAIFGVGSAWLIALCHFPGRGILQWALILPLAVPPYISAYYYTDFFSYSGALQTGFRYLTGLSSNEYWFPSLSNQGGASFIFASVLYPYVYLTSRVLFAGQGRCILDAARTLGASPWRVFFTVALPVARPAIVVGMSLVAMETLNDIGTVDYLGVDMLALAVFDTWLNRGSLAGAAQIALVLLLFVMFLLILEKRARQAKILEQKNSRGSSTKYMFRLSGFKSISAIFFCSIPIIFGFLVPLFLLIHSTVLNWNLTNWPLIWSAFGNSLTVSFGAALTCFFLALVMVTGARQTKKKLPRGFISLGSMGYAIPGTILGVGTLIALSNFDNWLDGHMRIWFEYSTGLLLTGSIAGLIIACATRFMAMTQGSMQTVMDQTPRSIDHAARTLGNNDWGVFLLIHVPLLAKAGLAGALLVFVDTLKELSATLVLIPFNYTTLATLLYEKASNAVVEEGSIAALAIIIAGLGPVIYVSHNLSKMR